MTRTIDWDVLVVGGGPAGAAAALELARLGRRVGLAEASPQPRFRLGETLPGVARHALHELGVFEAFVAQRHTASYAVRSAWGSDDVSDSLSIYNPDGGGWHLDRLRFDSLLLAAAEANGVEVLRGGRVVEMRRAGTDWEVRLDAPTGERTLRVSFLIDATGRAAWLSRRLGGRTLRCDRLVGVARRYAAEDAPDPYILVEAFADGWCYSAPLPDDDLVAVCLSDADLLTGAGRGPGTQFDAWLSATTHTRRRVAGRTARPGLQVQSAASSRTLLSADGGWLAVGDAAAAFDPLSSLGLCFALRSGLHAARAVHQRLAGRTAALAEYLATLDRVADEHMEQRVAYYRAEQRWPTSSFWCRRQTASS